MTGDYKMRCLRVYTPLTVCLIAGAIASGYRPLLGQSTAADGIASDLPLYHSDPEHLWNRLHQTLFVRSGPDGRTYGHDRVEPLLWPHSKHLLDAPTNERAVAVFNEFLNCNGEKLIEDPLKRAILQRDLWLVFNWLEGDHNNFADPPLATEEARAARERLRRPLASVIGRVALSPREIRDLPDNYAAAIASGEFARSFDPQHAERPYLPPDLFDAAGPWVCVGRTDGITAPRHLQENQTNRFTNSVFLLFLRLPDGRAATIAYLKDLGKRQQPLLVRAEGGESNPRPDVVPNPRVPQMPKGTEMAFVRRMMLVDSSDGVAASPLTEVLQLRVFHGDVPNVSGKALSDAFLSSRASRTRVASWQSFQEFRFSRSELFAGRAGGLRAVGPNERDFHTGFQSHPRDEFERPIESDQAFPGSNQQVVVREHCFACHSLPGVFSFNSLQNFRSGISEKDEQLRPFPLAVMRVSEVTNAAIAWKQLRPSFLSLRALLTE